MTHLLIYVNIYYDPFLLLCKLTKSLNVTFPRELFPAQASYEPEFSTHSEMTPWHHEITRVVGAGAKKCKKLPLWVQFF